MTSVALRSGRGRLSRPICLLLLTTAFSLPASAANWLYTVRPGDTLWDLCLRYTNKPGCWYKLDKVNGVKLPRQLPPGFVIKFPVDWLKEVPMPVAVRFLKGEVEVQRTEQAQKYPLVVNQLLPIGSVITTGEGTASLEFADGSTMVVEPHTSLVLDTLSTTEGSGMVDSSVRLQQGAIKTRVLKRQPATQFKISTPSAVAAVRGTEYRISADADNLSKTRGEVFEGLVDISANKSLQAVEEGFGIIAQAGAPLPPPKELLPPPVLTESPEQIMLPGRIAWEEINKAQYYIAELLNPGPADEVLERETLQTGSYSLDDLDEGCYQLRVRGIDEDELWGLPTVHPFCIVPGLPTAELSRKGVEYQERNSATLSWSAVPGADAYRVQISTQADFSGELEEHILKQPEIAISADGERYIRVQVIGPAGETTPFSEPYKWSPQLNPWWSMLIVGLFILVSL